MQECAWQPPPPLPTHPVDFLPLPTQFDAVSGSVDHDDALAVFELGDVGGGEDEDGVSEVETVIDGYMQCARALAELALRPRLRGLMVDEVCGRGRGKACR